eukprot:766997-Hanusia_phi.AAC.5
MNGIQFCLSLSQSQSLLCLPLIVLCMLPPPSPWRVKPQTSYFWRANHSKTTHLWRGSARKDIGWVVEVEDGRKSAKMRGQKRSWENKMGEQDGRRKRGELISDIDGELDYRG